MYTDDTIKTSFEWVKVLVIQHFSISIPKFIMMHQVSSIDPLNLQPENIRKTSIICTIGPKTNSVEMMNELREAGMNVVRLNFSHGSYEYHASVIRNLRQSCEERPGRPVAIALDTKGPEIRTGMVMNDGEIEIKAGMEIIFTVNENYQECCDEKIVFVDYKNLPKVISKGKKIYVDDGVITFEVMDVEGDVIRVVARNNGKLGSRKGVNLPGSSVDLPALSEKDKSDLQFGVEQGVDMIFASFIRSAQDIRDIRKVLGEKGKDIMVIAKIENHQGVDNFDSILEESDGVMVARGDLGIEIPSSRVFIAQKMMIAKCNLAGKPVICATQMLETMTYNPRPTRAEVSDVANAVLDGADCVMLSGETAKGIYPLEAVSTMHETCVLAESVICYPPLFNELRALQPRPTETTETVASSAVSAAHEQQAGAILVLTTSGKSARLVAKYRPSVPIIPITRNPICSRQVHLYRGCYPLLYPYPRPNPAQNPSWQEDVDARLRWGMQQGAKQGLLKPGSTVIAIQGWRGGVGNSNTIRILQVPEFY
ncbi:uncharacterized protein VTP21DRAFT_6493 [Calcarisporiella thermophila]|uniref:uncharacterized protein n=1 Tax=Calcarisporiella thermophila TaxID=911321 RepID=UPI0037438F24